MSLRDRLHFPEIHQPEISKGKLAFWTITIGIIGISLYLGVTTSPIYKNLSIAANDFKNTPSPTVAPEVQNENFKQVSTSPTPTELQNLNCLTLAEEQTMTDLIVRKLQPQTGEPITITLKTNYGDVTYTSDTVGWKDDGRKQAKNSGIPYDDVFLHTQPGSSACRLRK